MLLYIYPGITHAQNYAEKRQDLLSFNSIIAITTEDKKAPTEVVQRRAEGAERYTDDDTEQIKIMAPLEVGIAMSFDEYRKYGAILNEMFKELLNVDLIEK
uniref:Uncharacterized protein LOC116942313 isoform X2 n=1 Tax=Petromyzon marinus TaxID=7757 RepID=A0AAJ7WV84_PETMA|nr:uncharacterized protein LOC116942313 isoform X2 [Petromyzon marinus]